jgi:peroxiredoxin
MSPRGFELVAISVDDSSDVVEGFVERMGLSFPVLLDEDQAVSRDYQTMGYPESLLIDRTGTIVERYVGPKPWDEPSYLARVERLLNEQ